LGSEKAELVDAVDLKGVEVAVEGSLGRLNDEAEWSLLAESCWV
jgi:hypothetical protein